MKKGLSMMIERLDPSKLSVKAMPDGSKIIVNSENQTVLALNTTAAAAWEACNDSSSLSEVTDRMKQALGSEISEELAEQSILKLEEQNLVTTSGAYKQTSRRAVLATLGTIALPLVASLTLTEQRAFAGMAGSGKFVDDKDSPPDQLMKFGDDKDIPPGQLKKFGDDKDIPPGQVKKLGNQD
jgi:hypothetical protein